MRQDSRTQIPEKYIKTARFLQFFSKGLATSYAIKLFGTPLRHDRPERELAMTKSAQVTMLNVPDIKKTIKVFSYGYSKKRVLLVHGWSGRGTQLYRLADKLLENGYMVISFDAPAHGDSTGKTTLLIEFISAALAIQKVHGPFVSAIGHSLGGITVLNSISQGLQIQKAVTIAAGDSITYFLEEITNTLKLHPSILKRIKKRFFKKYGEDIEEYSGSKAAGKVKIPVLVVHDNSDKEVPVRCAHSIRQNLLIGQLLIKDNLGHRRILNDSDTLGAIVNFINE
jgi:pimeloyl-ACP methyl ester carboxylesterase